MIKREREREKRLASLQAAAACGLSPEVVIVESIFLIPESIFLPSNAVHSVNDEDKVLKELGGHVFVDPVMVDSQLEGNVQHHHTEECHPRSTVGLLQNSTRWEGFRAIKDTCEK